MLGTAPQFSASARQSAETDPADAQRPILMTAYDPKRKEGNIEKKRKPKKKEDARFGAEPSPGVSSIFLQSLIDHVGD